MGASEARWATAADDAALRELCRRTPMRGPVSYVLEREPDFFALTQLQGGRVAVIGEGEDILAMGMLAPTRVWIGGQPRQSAYIGDLKVHPSHRGIGLAGRIIRFIGDELRREGIDHSFFLVLSGNPMLQQIEDSDSQFSVRQLRAIRNYLVLFGSPRLSSAAVSRPTAGAIPEMIALWNRVNSRRTFAPVLDEKLLARWTLDDFIVVHRGGRMVAFCAAWDATAIKQLRVLRLSAALRASTILYNAVAPFLRRPRFPRAGEQLRFLYLSHVCAESAEDLEALLAHVHDERRREGYLYIDIALDRDDPLAGALARFRSMTVDFEIWGSETPPGCSYFDMSLV